MKLFQFLLIVTSVIVLIAGGIVVNTDVAYAAICPGITDSCPPDPDPKDSLGRYECNVCCNCGNPNFNARCFLNGQERTCWYVSGSWCSGYCYQ